MNIKELEAAVKDLNSEDDKLNFQLTNLNPRPNPIKYMISSLQDIADCITNENVDGFLIDFEGALRSVILLKTMVDEGEKIVFPPFEWTDDWQPKKDDW